MKSSKRINLKSFIKNNKHKDKYFFQIEGAINKVLHNGEVNIEPYDPSVSFPSQQLKHHWVLPPILSGIDFSDFSYKINSLMNYMNNPNVDLLIFLEVMVNKFPSLLSENHQGVDYSDIALPYLIHNIFHYRDFPVIEVDAHIFSLLGSTVSDSCGSMFCSDLLSVPSEFDYVYLDYSKIKVQDRVKHEDDYVIDGAFVFHQRLDANSKLVEKWISKDNSVKNCVDSGFFDVNSSYSIFNIQLIFHSPDNPQTMGCTDFSFVFGHNASGAKLFDVVFCHQGDAEFEDRLSYRSMTKAIDLVLFNYILLKDVNVDVIFDPKESHLASLRTKDHKKKLKLKEEYLSGVKTLGISL